MNLLDLRELIYYVFEDRILVNSFTKNDLLHLKKCIDIAIKNKK